MKPANNGRVERDDVVYVIPSWASPIYFLDLFKVRPRRCRPELLRAFLCAKPVPIRLGSVLPVRCLASNDCLPAVASTRLGFAGNKKRAKNTAKGAARTYGEPLGVNASTGHPRVARKNSPPSELLVGQVNQRSPHLRISPPSTKGCFESLPRLID